MYVSIRHYDGVKSPNEVVSKVQAEFLPLISKIPGFEDYYVIKTGNDAMTSVSVFKDRPSADQSVKTAAKWAEKSMPRHLPNPPTVMHGEVVYHRKGETKKTAA